MINLDRLEKLESKTSYEEPKERRSERLESLW